MRPPLDVNFFLGLTMEGGAKVGDLQMREGHYLLWKIPLDDTSSIIKLPDNYKDRAIKNIVAIKGFVVAASKPWHPQKPVQYWVWDKDQEMEVPKYRLVTMPEVTASVPVGSCCLYNSYNIAKITVDGIDDQLVIIREIDIEAWWPVECDASIGLGDHAMTCALFPNLGR